MMPFMPPPPICAARRLHDAGRSTRKLIGRAVALVSTGAITPSTRQCAGTAPAASTQAGAASVTPRTGAPMAAGGMDVPRRSAVQSAATPDCARATPDVAVNATTSATNLRMAAYSTPTRSVAPARLRHQAEEAVHDRRLGASRFQARGQYLERVLAERRIVGDVARTGR